MMSLPEIGTEYSFQLTAPCLQKRSIKNLAYFTVNIKCKFPENMCILKIML